MGGLGRAEIVVADNHQGAAAAVAVLQRRAPGHTFGIVQAAEPECGEVGHQGFGRGLVVGGCKLRQRQRVSARAGVDAVQPQRVALAHHVGALQHQHLVGVLHQHFADAVVGVHGGRYDAGQRAPRRNRVEHIGNLAQHPARRHIHCGNAAGASHGTDARQRAVLDQGVFHGQPGGAPVRCERQAFQRLVVARPGAAAQVGVEHGGQGDVAHPAAIGLALMQRGAHTPGDCAFACPQEVAARQPADGFGVGHFLVGLGAAAVGEGAAIGPQQGRDAVQHRGAQAGCGQCNTCGVETCRVQLRAVITDQYIQAAGRVVVNARQPAHHRALKVHPVRQRGLADQAQAGGVACAGGDFVACSRRRLATTHQAEQTRPQQGAACEGVCHGGEFMRRGGGADARNLQENGLCCPVYKRIQLLNS